MRTFLSRLFHPTSKRSLDAAAGGRRWEGAKGISNLNATLSAAGPVLRHRGGYYARNNPWLVKGIASIVGNVVGTGIKPQSRHPDEGVREKLHTLFSRWSDGADTAGRTDFYGLQALAVRGMVETGEAFLRFRPQPLTGTAVPLKLQMLAPDQVDATLHRDLDGDRRIRAGVEMDGDGRRIAYHVLPGRPGDVLGMMSHTPIRLPAEDILHVFEQLEAGQIRGLTALASILMRLHELDMYEDAQLVRQKVAALFAGFLIDPNGDGGGFEGSRTGSILDTGLEPGTLKTLPPGYDIRFSEPADVGDAVDFVRVQLRAIAAGLGCTYEQLTGDLTGVNYSSIRAGLVEFRRRVDALRWSVLIPQLCQPVWERFIHTAVVAGRIPAADFARDPDAFLMVDWQPPGWEWVDPAKDIAAEQAAVDAGFKARSQVIHERGDDPEQVDRMRAADVARETRVGIQSPSKPPPAAANQHERPPTSPPPGKEDEDAPEPTDDETPDE